MARWPSILSVDYWVIGAVVLALVLVFVNSALFFSNQSLQSQVNQRQQFINQSTQFGRVYEGIVRGLANAAVANKDDKLRDLLAANGFTITAGSPATASPTAADPAASSASPKTTPTK